MPLFLPVSTLIFILCSFYLSSDPDQAPCTSLRALRERARKAAVADGAVMSSRRVQQQLPAGDSTLCWSSCAPYRGQIRSMSRLKIEKPHSTLIEEGLRARGKR